MVDMNKTNGNSAPEEKPSAYSFSKSTVNGNEIMHERFISSNTEKGRFTLTESELKNRKIQLNYRIENQNSNKIILIDERDIIVQGPNLFIRSDADRLELSGIVDVLHEFIQDNALILKCSNQELNKVIFSQKMIKQSKENNADTLRT
jgi:hypothetical protein